MQPDAPLGEPLQAAFVTAIRRPGGVPGTSVGFADFLRRSGIAESDVEALTASGAQKRFALYRELVRNRFRGALDVSLPLTLERLGARRIDEDLDAFLEVRASRSPYLRDVAGEFVEFAVGRWSSDPSVPAYLPDLARHELLSFEVAAAADDDPAPSGSVTVNSQLVFQRAARIATYRFAVHRLTESPDPREPEPRSCRVLAYRARTGNARFLELSPFAEALLERLLGGESLGNAAHATCSELDLPMDDTTLAEIGVLLDDLEGRGVILGAR